MLPTPNILYKVPDMQSVATEFLPEFLKDNNNVSVSYPGENQFVWSFEVPETDYTLIETGPDCFNEAHGDLDIRAQFTINSNAKNGNGDGYFSDVYPKVRYENFTREAPSSDLRQDDIYFDQSLRLTEPGKDRSLD